MSKVDKIAAIILAAGSGSRLGNDRPKQYRLLAGEPLLRRIVRVFVTHANTNPVIVVIPVGDLRQAQESLGELADDVILVEGGATRQQSALLGLRELTKSPPAYVHIHDAARPFVSHQLLDDITLALTPQSGVVPGVAVTDTLKKRGENGEIIATLERRQLYQAQTPQSFPFPGILAAHEQAVLDGRDDFTDDSSVAEGYGLKMQSIDGDVNNIKITHLGDWERAHRYLEHFPKSVKRFSDKKCGKNNKL